MFGPINYGPSNRSLLPSTKQNTKGKKKKMWFEPHMYWNTKKITPPVSQTSTRYTLKIQVNSFEI